MYSSWFCTETMCTTLHAELHHLKFHVPMIPHVRQFTWSQSKINVVEGTFSQQPAQPQREGQVVLLGTLDHPATEETPVDGGSVMKNLYVVREPISSP